MAPPLCLFVVLFLFHLCPLSASRLFSSALGEDSFRELRAEEPQELRRHLKEKSKTFVKVANGFLPAGHELHAFVKFSAYRDNMTDFYVVGLASATLKSKWGDPVIGCNWLPSGSSLREIDLVATTPTIITAARNDMHGMEYIALIVQCTFPIEVGGKDGGTLYLRVPRHQENYRARLYGADDMLPVLSEASIDPNLYRPEQNTDANDKRFRHKFAICSAPTRTNANATILLEWILWHKAAFQEDVHFVIYVVEDLGVNLRAVLEKFEDDKLVTIVHAEDQSLYESWYFHQVLFINDCIHRSRHVAKWALHIDYDEFLHVRSEYQNFPELFDHYKDAGALYFSRVRHSIPYCLPQTKIGQWAIELRAFRPKSKCQDFDMHCQNDKVPKWAVNLNAALVGQVHFVYKFTSEVEQINVDENVALIFHLSGIVANGASECLNIVNNIADHPDVIWDPLFTKQVTQLVEDRQWQHLEL